MLRALLRGAAYALGRRLARRLGFDRIGTPSTGRVVGTPSPVVAAGLRRDPEDDAAEREFQRISRAARRAASRAFELARGRPRQGVLLRRLDGDKGSST
jgi:hypothetical protein